MDASKDYYAILGVLPSIEQTALKAVYLALLKKYHPDVYKGNISDAERITKELNEAYSVLGDQTKRAEYDALRKTRNSNDGDFSQETTTDGNDDSDQELERDWKFVVEYFPEAEECRKELHEIAKSLSISFQYIILTKKLTSQSKILADLLKSEYLRRYFGSNEEIQKFAIKMLKLKRRDVALELNNVIRILGTPSDDKISSLIENISIKFKLEFDLNNNVNLKYKIINIFKTFTIFQNGEYYAELKNGKIIGSNDNKKYYLFDNIKHYKNATTKNIIYWKVKDQDYSIFYKILENQKEINNFI